MSQNSFLHETNVKRLPGMFRNWFLDFSSYVILDRAVPHIDDGLKPVQRRILHAMKTKDEGRFIKVANIVGETMKFHPHGDKSIGDALVALGQKNLMVDHQGNWGNILTGDDAAAPRYIEARLSKLALEVVFNRRTTEWMRSYDGTGEEPVALPMKFPLLLAQGTDGIAVGLSLKILPHNFCELIDACIAHLKGEDFVLYPDFPTGGIVDVSHYNDGRKGGFVKVRARIEVADRHTLVITEIPFGSTTQSIRESITKARDQGKIKLSKITDETSSKARILLTLPTGQDPEKTIDALYAFTSCETSIYVNACVIVENHPRYMGVSDILRYNADRTRNLLRQELEIKIADLEESIHRATLEKIFIENRIYLLMENCGSREEAYTAVGEGLKPFLHLATREVGIDDVKRLTELPFVRITKYDSSKTDTEIANNNAAVQETRSTLASLTEYTIEYFRQLGEKYGKAYPRRTEISEIKAVRASAVAIADETLHVDRKEGFFGIGKSMKDAEAVCKCSSLDDVLVILRDGRYMVKKVADKVYAGKDIIYAAVYRRQEDLQKVFNVIYRDDQYGRNMVKRCFLSGMIRDKEYNLTAGTAGSRIIYLSCGEADKAERVKVVFRPSPKMKKQSIIYDFAALAVKGKASRGNVLSPHQIFKVTKASATEIQPEFDGPTDVSEPTLF